MLVRRARRLGAARCAASRRRRVDLADHDPDRRAALVGADGLDRVLVAPSTPLGHRGAARRRGRAAARRLPRGRRRAARRRSAPGPRSACRDPDPAALPRLLDAGLRRRLRAGRRARRPGRLRAPRPGARDARAPRRAAARPSRARRRPPRRAAPPGGPALTDYVAAMQTAWHAFAVWGRPAHPRLRVCFAMLAGLAPLHRERLRRPRRARRQRPRTSSSTSPPTATRAVDAVRPRDRRRPARPRLATAPSSPPASCRSATRCDVALRERNPARLLGTEAAA